MAHLASWDLPDFQSSWNFKMGRVWQNYYKNCGHFALQSRQPEAQTLRSNQFVGGVTFKRLGWGRGAFKSTPQTKDFGEKNLARNFFWPKSFFDPKKMLARNFFELKLILTQKIFWTKKFDQNIFWPEKILNQNFFLSPKNFDLPKNFNPKTCWPKNTLNPKKFRPSKNVDPKTMRCQWGGGGGHSGKPYST